MSDGNSYPASRLVANAAIVVGAFWIVVVLVSAMVWAKPLEHLPASRSWVEIAERFFGALVRFTPIVAPGIATVYIGNQLQKRVEVDTVRPAVAAVSFMAVMTVGVTPIVFDGLSFQPVDMARAGHEIWFFIIIATIALPVYAMVCRQVLKHDGIQAEGVRDIFTKPILVLLLILAGSYAFPATSGLLSYFFMDDAPVIAVISFTMAVSIGAFIYMAALYVLDQGWSHPADDSLSNGGGYSASKHVALISMAAGAICIALAVGLPVAWSLAEPIAAGAPWFNRYSERILALAVVAPALVTPGLYCLYQGRKLSRTVTLRGVRQTVAALLVAALFVTSMVLALGPFYATPLHDPFLRQTLAALLVPGVPIYVAVCRWVAMRDRISVEGLGNILTKHVVFWSSVIVALVSNYAVARTVYAVAVSGGRYSPGLEIPMLFVFPMLVAWLFYRIAGRALGHENPRKTNPQLWPVS